jgi:hypothetical protein
MSIDLAQLLRMLGNNIGRNERETIDTTYLAAAKGFSSRNPSPFGLISVIMQVLRDGKLDVLLNLL